MPQISDLVMPKLGLTMTEGTISEWVVSPGDSFSSGDLVLVVETDKIANEIEAPADGTLHDVIVQVGETVPVGTVLARWDVGTAGTPEPVPVATPPSGPVAVNSGATSDVLDAKPASAISVDGARVIATPLARRIAGLEGVDLHKVSGTGPKGRIKAEDVRKAKQAAPVATERAIPIEHATSGTRLTPTTYQASVAKRLTEAKRDTPHFYLSTEADVGALLDIRKQLNAANADLRVSINHLILAAVGRTLADMPAANRIWSNGEIVQYETADVGIAVTTDAGLFAPVVRDMRPSSFTSMTILPP